MAPLCSAFYQQTVIENGAHVDARGTRASRSDAVPCGGLRKKMKIAAMTLSAQLEPSMMPFITFIIGQQSSIQTAYRNQALSRRNRVQPAAWCLRLRPQVP